MKHPDSNALEDGADSGPVREPVKRQLWSDQLGICAEPTCNNRIDAMQTRLGECAHIIPRRVGSHPREDYATPLDARRKQDNLLYLCEKHHKIVDNIIHANMFTADVLRGWKKDHEQWAAGVTKNSPYISPQIKTTMAELTKQLQQDLAERSDASIEILESLLASCKEVLDRNLLQEAGALLSVMELSLLDWTNPELKCEADTLEAILLARTEEIPEAKRRLLRIIKAHPNAINPMLEYIELCEGFPEPADESEHIEVLARELDSAHPRLQLLALARTYERGEVDDQEPTSCRFNEDIRLKSRLICQQSLFCDLKGDYQERDKLVQQWEEHLPTSPRPHFFRALYSTLDTLRVTPDKSKLDQAVALSSAECERIRVKDPLALRDQINWRMHDMKMSLASSQIGREVGDVRRLSCEICNLIAQCYFGRFVDNILSELLAMIVISREQWIAITGQLQESSVKPSEETTELLFSQALQYDDIQDDLIRFTEKAGAESLSELLQFMKNRQAQEAAAFLNERHRPRLSLNVIHAIRDPRFRLQMLEYMEVDDEYESILLYARIETLASCGRDDAALELLSSLPLEVVGAPALDQLAKLAFKNERWALFIPPARRLSRLPISSELGAQLNAQLAFAFYKQGDDSNCIMHAEHALAERERLSEHNSQVVLHVLGQAYLLKGHVDKACHAYLKYGDITRTFGLLLEEAELLLKSNLGDRYSRALGAVVAAFKLAGTYDDNTFLSAFMLLVELGNANAMELKNEEIVEDGLFVKVEGFKDGWFYIGSDDAGMGATCVPKGTANYDALIRRAVAESIEWPAEKFSGERNEHKVVNIRKLPAYLSQRAHEAMENKARIGGAPIWSIRMLKEDGSLDAENIRRFYEEQFRSNSEFFDSYVSSIIPFAFLCRMEGSLAQAIGKIAQEQRGFIHCNNGTSADLDGQRDTAHASLNGQPCSIDGLAALVLAESGLFESVISALPVVHVSTSVIRLLRETAGALEVSASNQGRASFVRGALRYHPVDKSANADLRYKLLAAADLLDTLPTKTITNNYSKSGDAEGIDHIVPEYFVDPFRIAQSKGAALLTDDAFLIQAYSALGETSLPSNMSSLSLVRVLVDTKTISWDKYIDYFSLLSSYRYRLLPISSAELRNAVFPPSPRGLVLFQPKNLFKLNLKLVLSREYGVDEDVLVKILSQFFLTLIIDDSVTDLMANELFKVTLVETLDNRNKRLVGRAILQICAHNIPGDNWISELERAKWQGLEAELSRYLMEYSPIITG